jgi:hypothetical protein
MKVRTAFGRAAMSTVPLGIGTNVATIGARLLLDAAHDSRDTLLRLRGKTVTLTCKNMVEAQKGPHSFMTWVSEDYHVRADTITVDMPPGCPAERSLGAAFTWASAHVGSYGVHMYGPFRGLEPGSTFIFKIDDAGNVTGGPDDETYVEYKKRLGERRSEEVRLWMQDRAPAGLEMWRWWQSVFRKFGAVVPAVALAATRLGIRTSDEDEAMTVMGCPLNTKFLYSMPSPIAEYMMHRDHVVGPHEDMTQVPMNDSHLLTMLTGVFLGLMGQTDRIFAGGGMSVDSWIWDWDTDSVAAPQLAERAMAQRGVWEKWMVDAGLRVETMRENALEAPSSITFNQSGCCRLEPWVLEVCLRGEQYCTPRPPPELGERMDIPADGKTRGVFRDVTVYASSPAFVGAQSREHYTAIEPYPTYIIRADGTPAHITGGVMLSPAVERFCREKPGGDTLGGEQFRSVDILPTVTSMGSCRVCLLTPPVAQPGPLGTLGVCHQPREAAASCRTDMGTESLSRIGSFFRGL